MTPCKRCGWFVINMEPRTVAATDKSVKVFKYSIECDHCFYSVVSASTKNGADAETRAKIEWNAAPIVARR